MAEITNISWTATVLPDGTHIPGSTFNPWLGCTKISESCKNCFAERENTHYGWVDQWGPLGTRKRTSETYWKQPLAWNKKAKASGQPWRVFCGSLCDVFEDRPELYDWREDLWRLLEATPYLTWMLLTKRPENIRNMMPYSWFDNVWLGTSVEDQKTANQRIPKLLEIPAKVRFLSCEPLLGSIDLTYIQAGTTKGGDYISPVDVLNRPLGFLPWISWTIIGTESGPNRRPAKIEWIESLVKQGKQAGVATFVKQIEIDDKVSHDIIKWPLHLQVQEFPNANS